MKISLDETIAAPQDRVFAVFSDLEHAAERINGIAKLEILSDVRRGKGLRWRETRVMMGREATEEMEITEFDPPRHYAVEAASHGMHYRTDIHFAPLGAGTRVSHIFEGVPQNLGARILSILTGPLFASMTKKALGQDMADLKKLIESDRVRR